MIYSLEGTPGTGKSLFLVQKIIPDFLKVRGYDGSLQPVHIWTNIEGLKPELIIALLGLPSSLMAYFHKIGEFVDEETGEVREDKRYLQYFYYDPATIKWVQTTDEKKRVVWVPDESKAQYLPINSLVILDEVQNIFGSRDFAEYFSKACIKYLTRHRHYGHTIWWASQHVEQVDVTFRRNTQYVWFLESLENYALVGGDETFKISKYEGWLAGVKTGVPPYSTEKVKKDKRFFNCYKSHVGEKGQVKEVRYKSNMWTNNKGLRIVAGLLVVCLVFAFFAGSPLKAITGQKKGSPAAAAKFTGLAPALGAQGVNKVVSDSTYKVNENDFVCIENNFVHNGVPYVVINGITQKPKAGVIYDRCHNKENK